MINATQIGERLWRVEVDLLGITGTTMIACFTKQEAEDYAKYVFLPDLRRNDWRLANVIFPWEADYVPEPEEPDEYGYDKEEE